MELHQLRAFVAVVDAGTYLAASERLHLAQPALWKKVQRLEADLGVALFVRSGRRVTPTATGDELAQRARLLLEAAADLERLAEGHASAAVGVVRVGCSPPHIQRVLADAVAACQRANPGIRVQLREWTPSNGRDGGDPDSLLRRGAIDLAIGLPAADDVATKHLYRAHVVLPVPESHHLYGRRKVDVRALEHLPVLVSPPGSLSRSLLDAACQTAGFAPNIVHESAYPQALLALAASGVGTPVIADDNVPAVGRASPRLTAQGSGLSAEVVAYWLADRPPSPATRLLLSHVGKALT